MSSGIHTHNDSRETYFDATCQLCQWGFEIRDHYPMPFGSIIRAYPDFVPRQGTLSQGATPED